MGPTHSVSGAAFWLGGALAGVPLIAGQDLASTFAGAAVCAGACLWNDIDCPGQIGKRNGSTVVNAFGPIGKTLGVFFNNVSLAVYMGTKTAREKPRRDGHRTLTHTAVFAVATGLVVSGLASLPGTVDVLGKSFSTGALMSLLFMWIGLHLALFGLAENFIRRMRNNFGLLYVMLFSAVVTLTVATFLPNSEGSYPWLGLAFGAGTLLHNAGDMITRLGVPICFPIKINGKRWWDVRIPITFAIKAGGEFERRVLFPALSVLTVLLALGLVVPNLFGLFQ